MVDSSKGRPPILQADGQALGVEASVDGYGRGAGQVEGPGHRRRQVAGLLLGRNRGVMPHRRGAAL